MTPEEEAQELEERRRNSLPGQIEALRGQVATLRTNNETLTGTRGQARSVLRENRARFGRSAGRIAAPDF